MRLPATSLIYTLSLHDALPICLRLPSRRLLLRHQVDAARQQSFPLAVHDQQVVRGDGRTASGKRSEEHTSELQSQSNLVCRLLLEKKKHKEKHEPSIAPDYTLT